MKNIIFEQLENKRKLIKTKRSLTYFEIERLKKDFITDYIYNSNAIEGNSLTLRETAYVLDDLTVWNKPLKDHLEVVGHKDAFDLVFELVERKVPLTEEIIKQLHSYVLLSNRKNRGIYRNVPVYISGSNHHTVPPEEIETEMNKLLEDYNKSKENLVEKLANFHLRFESIHPFIDGNGRTGRLIINLELLKAGFPPINIKYSDRKAYFNAFEDYHKSKSTDNMAKLFTKYLSNSLDTNINLLKISN